MTQARLITRLYSVKAWDSAEHDRRLWYQRSVDETEQGVGEQKQS